MARRKAYRPPTPDVVTPVREAVGVFHEVDALRDAIDALQRSGFDRAELSVLAAEATVDEKLGQTTWRTTALKHNPEAPRGTHVAPEEIAEAKGVVLGTAIGGLSLVGAAIAAGGTIPGLIAGVALGAGTGAAIGRVLGNVIETSHADELSAQIERGGILLWIQLRDTEHEKRAVELLKAYGAFGVEVHNIRPTRGA